eukprot:PLAT799.1.p1 GENE.PLAT799.1~~PLAT799.1.p1  ORF type:complete len:478 (-),score=85.28 PLAT799.1:78-1388(-)
MRASPVGDEPPVVVRKEEDLAPTVFKLCWHLLAHLMGCGHVSCCRRRGFLPDRLRDISIGDKVCLLKERVYAILEVGSPLPGTAEVYVLRFLVAFIIVSVVLGVLDTLPEQPRALELTIDATEYLATVLFSLEYVLRLWSCTEDPKLRTPVKLPVDFEWSSNGDDNEKKTAEVEKSTGSGFYTRHAVMRLRFVLLPLSIMDVLAVLPLYLSLGSSDDDLGSSVVLRVFRISRLLKASRYSSSLGILTEAYRRKKDQLVTTMVFNLGMLCISSSIVFFLENPGQPAEFSSIPATMWWGVATLTTVGYGDIYPISSAGKLVGTLTAVLGIGFFALPAGIVSSAFIEISAEEREKRKARLRRMTVILNRIQMQEQLYAFQKWCLVHRMDSFHDVDMVLREPMPGAELRDLLTSMTEKIMTKIDKLDSRLTAIEGRLERS